MIDWELLLCIVSIIADVLGIIGFILTIVLLIYSEALRREFVFQQMDYQKNQNDMRIKLTGYRDSMLIDDVLNLKLISDIRTVIYENNEIHGRLSKLRDKIHTKKLLSTLKKPIAVINKRYLCNELDYFIARFERKEI